VPASSGARGPSDMPALRSARRAALVVTLWLLRAPLQAAPPVPGIEPPPPPREPRVAAASDEAGAAASTFGLPAGFAAEAWAAEPLLANPVAFSIDEQGRVYVCEAFRAHKGVGDNVRIADERWLDADLANDTVDERFASMVAFLGEKAKDWVVETDRLRRVVDADGDGRGDTATVFATGFNRLVEGHAAGVLARRGDVFLACIPNLWRFHDDGAGVGRDAVVLHTGYGVRTAIQGHDLHGLTLGPDGRIWFSIGDRGYSVEHAGKRLADPESGAVFRCEPDGSGLEVVATGLRNPQELAFDDLGNCFTCDNNTDGGDRTRLVYVMPGGDSGWRGPVQYLPDRGPFNRELLWRTPFDGQPAWVLPPVGHVGAGPAGFAAHPGTGLTPWFEGRFFLADFRGAAATSLVHTFRIRPRGAAFEMADHDETFRHVLATDVEVGPDGALWVSDWVQGWEGEGKGRLWRFFPTDPDPSRDAVVAEVRTLLGGDWSALAVERLRALLGHADRRVRREAQFELVRRGAAETLRAVASGDAPRLAKIHALEGLGQVRRRSGDDGPTRAAVEAAMTDADPGVRTVAARVAGDVPAPALSRRLLPLLDDREPHVRAAAALSIARQGAAGALPDDLRREAVAGIVRRVRVERDADDAHLRHALVMALAASATPAERAALAADADGTVRLLAVLAMRRTRDPALGRALGDPDRSVVLEAARAIYDLPVPEALDSLARRLSDGPREGPDGDAFLRRAIAANERVGTAEAARRLAEIVTAPAVPVALRLQAIDVLGSWASPPPRDRVWGAWRPIAARDPEPARGALAAALPTILAAEVGERVVAEALAAAARLGVPGIVASLAEAASDATRDPATRAAALVALEATGAGDPGAIALGLARDASPAVRAAARRVRAAVLARAPDAAALATLVDETVRSLDAPAVDEPTLREQQGAIDLLAALGPAGREPLGALQARLESGTLDPRLSLEVLEATGADRARILALAARGGGPLAGGDAARGHDIYLRKSSVECVRCHRVAGEGGIVGPALDGVAARHDRHGLLESMLSPSARLADGYRTTVLVTDEGRTLAGIVKGETPEEIVLVTGDGREERVPAASIEARSEGVSAMPADLAGRLSPRELRDLVEWLSTLRGPPATAP